MQQAADELDTQVGAARSLLEDLTGSESGDLTSFSERLTDLETGYDNLYTAVNGPNGTVSTIQQSLNTEKGRINNLAT